MGLILATDGFEDSELSYPYYRLQEADVEVNLATPNGDSIVGKHEYEFEADFAIDDHDADWWADEYDILVIPGGKSPEMLRIQAPTAAEIVDAFDTNGLPIASICHGAQLLISADILDDRTLTGYWTLEIDIENAGGTYVDEAVVIDDNLVTSRVPSDLPAFMRETINLLETADIPA